MLLHTCVHSYQIYMHFGTKLHIAIDETLHTKFPEFQHFTVHINYRVYKTFLDCKTVGKTLSTCPKILTWYNILSSHHKFPKLNIYKYNLVLFQIHISYSLLLFNKSIQRCFSAQNLYITCSKLYPDCFTNLCTNKYSCW